MESKKLRTRIIKLKENLNTKKLAKTELNALSTHIGGAKHD